MAVKSFKKIMCQIDLMSFWENNYIFDYIKLLKIDEFFTKILKSLLTCSCSFSNFHHHIARHPSSGSSNANLFGGRSFGNFFDHFFEGTLGISTDF